MPAGDLKATEFSLADFGRTLLRRKWVVVITLIVVVGGAVGYSARQPAVYRSTAGLLLLPQYSTNSIGALVTQGSNSLNVPTQIALVTSGPVKLKVRQTLGAAPPVTVTPEGATDLINISALAGTPVYAARVANAYANAYISVRQTQNLQTVHLAETQIQGQINSIQTQLQILEAQQTALLANPKASAAALSNVNTRMTSLQTQLNTYQQQLRQEQLLASLNQVGQLVNPALPVHAKVAPTPLRDGLIAALAGLLLGIGLAFLFEFFDDRIRSRDAVERVVPGVPVVAAIPDISDWRNRKKPLLVSVDRPRSNQAEAYRSLRTAVRFMGIDRPIGLLQITSPSANDGKTSTLANLAITIALAGQRVVAMSCDLRRPRLHEFFDVPNDVGLTSVLLGEATLAEALRTDPTQERLQVLPSGPIPPNPSELLSGAAIVEVFRQLKEQVDVVLVDSPPILPVTDATVLAEKMDAVLLVVAAGNSTKRAVRRAVDILARVNAPLEGIILNSASGKDVDGYDSGYGYERGYDAEPITNGSSANGATKRSRARRNAGTES